MTNLHGLSLTSLLSFRLSRLSSLRSRRLSRFSSLRFRRSSFLSRRCSLLSPRLPCVELADDEEDEDESEV